MSKASAWAARETARVAALEEAQRRIERELDAPSPDVAPMYFHRKNVLATVSQFDASGTLVFRMPGSMLAPHMTAAEAVEFARWILDTFGDEANVMPAGIGAPGATPPGPARRGSA